MLSYRSTSLCRAAMFPPGRIGDCTRWMAPVAILLTDPNPLKYRSVPCVPLLRPAVLVGDLRPGCSVDRRARCCWCCCCCRPGLRRRSFTGDRRLLRVPRPLSPPCVLSVFSARISIESLLSKDTTSAGGGVDSLSKSSVLLRYAAFSRLDERH